MTKFTLNTKSGPKKHLGGRYYLMSVFLSVFFIAGLLDGAFAIKRAEAAFTIDVPYQQAVPDFLEAITDATASVKDEGELEDIAQWEKEARAGLPEFLEDLITIAQQLEASGNEQFIVEEYQAFAEKWNAISQSYPGLSELEPVLGPIIDQLLSGLPTLQSTPSEGSPVGNLYDLYVEMTELNPWFVGPFWNIPSIENEQKKSEISEKTLERTVEGYKSIDILERNIVVQVNGAVVFSEFIKDGVLTNRSVLLGDPSILHETLLKMIEDGGVDREIAIVQELVDLADLNLELALEKGIIDDCSYSFIYRKRLNGTKKTCIDIIGNEQDFIEISKYDPFDQVNQVELTHVDSSATLIIPKAPSVSIGALPEPAYVMTLTESIVPFLGGAPVNIPDSPSMISNEPVVPVNPPLEAWLLGILTPAYLWSAAGLIRLF